MFPSAPPSSRRRRESNAHRALQRSAGVAHQGKLGPSRAWSRAGPSRRSAWPARYQLGIERLRRPAPVSRAASGRASRRPRGRPKVIRHGAGQTCRPVITSKASRRHGWWRRGRVPACSFFRMLFSFHLKIIRCPGKVAEVIRNPLATSSVCRAESRCLHGRTVSRNQVVSWRAPSPYETAGNFRLNVAFSPQPADRSSCLTRLSAFRRQVTSQDRDNEIPATTPCPRRPSHWPSTGCIGHVGRSPSSRLPNLKARTLPCRHGPSEEEVDRSPGRGRYDPAAR